MELRTWLLTFEQRGWSLNAERTWHFHKRNNEVKKWRTHFKEQAELLEIPRLNRISVEVFSTFGTKALQDPGNNMPAVKAAIDGLTAKVDKNGLTGAGIILDDSPEYIAYLRFWAPTYEKGYNSVCLQINEL